MKTRNICKGIALMAVALTTAACQNELKEENNEPQPGEKITMTIRATQGTAPQTRTIYEDKLETTGIEKVLVMWEDGLDTDADANKEQLYVFDSNGSNGVFTTPATLTSIPSTRSTDGASIDFTGTAIQAANYVAVYPISNCELDFENFIYVDFRGQTQDCTAGKEMTHLKKYDIMVGKLAATGTNNYTFDHRTIMLRFDLTLNKIEEVTQVTLTTSGATDIITEWSGSPTTGDICFGPITETDNISLAITNHNASTLKAYMMMPPFDASGDKLTVTVTTKGGSTYEGTITAAASQILKAGLCYTLAPTLALNTTITVPTITAGGLGNALNKIIPVAGQTELVLKSNGAINSNDYNVLNAFLKGAGTNITTLDLSGLNYPNETVVYLTGCTNLKEVILPTEATAIGDFAFSGCTSLAKVSQDEPATPSTRASVSSRMKTIGESAFKGTAINVMYLHANITTIGNNAFKDCSELAALVFEGAKTVGADLSIGTDIISGTTPSYLKVFLPKITETDKAVATSYKTKLGKDTYYNYKYTDYDTANENKKLTPANYTLLPSDPSATAPGLPGGEQLGDK